MMKQLRLLITLLLMISPAILMAEEEEAPAQLLEIADPYIDVHTGPGGGYPIFHVIERGEKVDVILRRTNWFKITFGKDLVGWVHIDQLQQSLMSDGKQVEFVRKTKEDFTHRKWEAGVMGGGFEGALQFSIYGAYLFNRGFAAELGYAEAIGANSSSSLIKMGLLMQPFPDWRVSPYFYLGTGHISVDVNETLAVPENRDNQFSNIGFGIRAFITKTIIFRAEVSDYVLFSADFDNDTNEDISEWKLGFAVFF